jgi:ferrous iron transport protein B
MPIFLAVMFAVFHLTFSENLLGIPGLPGPGVFLQTLVENLIAWFSGAIATLFEPDSWAESLVIDGVVGGVGSVLSFVPKILLLFLFLTLLEDCGYMARAAFIMDRLFKKFGLSGKSFLPMLMGFGCTVPAAMACRTMENEQDRKLTLMLVPFMSCGARAPIFLVFAGAFFPSYSDVIVFGLYFLGILVAVISGIILRKLLFKGEFSPFIIELPRYRAPRAHSVALTLWDKFKGYLVRAGTIIFAMCVVVWFLSSFGFADGGFTMVPINDSLLATVGNVIAPIFSPLGFGTWIAAVAILTGFIAKESVVGTLGVLLNVGEEEAVAGNGLTVSILAAAGFTPLVALSFMVFCLLYIPCMAAFATLKKEFGSWKWAFGQAAYSTGIAYLVAFLVYQIGRLIV